VPILGSSWSFNEYIFLKRVWEQDQKTLSRDLGSIFDYPKDLPFTITLFCEGTRFTKEKHEASMEVAKQKGLPLLKHHLLPRTKGFFLVASQLKGKGSIFLIKSLK
jgi:lysophosphatidic acid acyltransferase/lysophosphatidylinositol acyltransferase